MLFVIIKGRGDKLKIKTILKDKKAEVFTGTFLCIMIIMIAFSLMSITFLVNTHYKVTREMEHSLTLLQTSVQKDAYNSLETFTPEEYKNSVSNYKLRTQYENLLKENSLFTYNEKTQSFVGDGFEIKDITINYSIPDEQIEDKLDDKLDYGFSVDYTVTATINYTTNLMLSDKPITLTTGKINFTSSYGFLDDVNDFENQRGNSDSSKYDTKG